MNQKELALEKCEDEFDFFNTNFKKPISEFSGKTESQPNTTKNLLLKLLLIAAFPPIAFFAAMSGMHMADNVWETATGKKVEKAQQSQLVPYFTHIMKMNQKLQQDKLDIQLTEEYNQSAKQKD